MSATAIPHLQTYRVGDFWRVSTARIIYRLTWASDDISGRTEVSYWNSWRRRWELLSVHQFATQAVAKVRKLVAEAPEECVALCGIHGTALDLSSEQPCADCKAAAYSQDVPSPNLLATAGFMATVLFRELAFRCMSWVVR